MFRYFHIRLMIVTVLFFISSIITSQEFAITTGNTTTNVRGAAFDGTNYLIGIQGDAANSNTITGQLVSASGGLIGNRISFGRTGKGPLVAFDGTNYLLVFSDIANAVLGQLISTSGSLVGTTFVIAQAIPFAGKGGCIAYEDGYYLVVRTQNDIHYGQRIDKSGNVVGSPVRISNNPGGENAIAFDGTNFLVAFRDQANDKDIYGQFVSKAGALVGSNFIIDNGPYLSDNPVSIAYDGTRYLVAFHEQAGDGKGWNLFARFVTPSGVVAPNRITIRDSTYTPGFPYISYDANNFLILWTDGAFSTNSVIMGRFFNKSGVPVNNAFTVFQSIGSKVPFYGIPIFANNKFLAVTFRVESANFVNGDVFGKFLQPLTDINKDESNLLPTSFSLQQNYPNPFNPITTIKYSIPKSCFVTLSIYDLLGRKVQTLVQENKVAGNYSVKFDAGNFTSGVYVYQLQAENYTEAKKLILIK